MKLTGAALLLGCLAAAAVEPASQGAAIEPSSQGAKKPREIEHFAPAGGWDGFQYLQADKKGRLWLLRAKTLEVFAWSPGGKLGPAKRLVAAANPVAGAEHVVLAAAMSPNGDWLIQDGFQPRLFRGDKEVPLTLPRWIVSAVAFSGEDPVIAGSPLSVDDARGFSREMPAAVDLLARWQGRRWEPLVTASKKGRKALDPMALSEQRMVRLAPSSARRLWVGFQFQIGSASTALEAGCSPRS